MKPVPLLKQTNKQKPLSAFTLDSIVFKVLLIYFGGGCLLFVIYLFIFQSASNLLLFFVPNLGWLCQSPLGLSVREGPLGVEGPIQR